MLAALAFRKRAEGAMKVADVCVIDVPRHHVRDGIAVHAFAHLVGGCAHGGKCIHAGAEERHDSAALQSQPLTARSNIRTNPSPAGAGQAHMSRRRDGDSICTCGIEICAPGAQSSVLAKPWLSIDARIWDRMAESAHFCASRAKEG